MKSYGSIHGYYTWLHSTVLFLLSCWLPLATQSHFCAVSIRSYLDHCWHLAWPSSILRAPDGGVLPTPALMPITYMYQVWAKLLPTCAWCQTHYHPVCFTSFPEKCTRHCWADVSWDSTALGPAATLAENLNFYLSYILEFPAIFAWSENCTTKQPKHITTAPCNKNHSYITTAVVTVTTGGTGRCNSPRV